MAAVLKWVSERVPWSLVLKALLFGAAWYLSRWFGIALAGAFLLFPALPFRVPVATAIFALLALVAVPAWYTAAFLAGVFLLVLGIHQHRILAYEAAHGILTLLLAVAAFFTLFQWSTYLHPAGMLWMPLGFGVLGWSIAAETRNIVTATKPPRFAISRIMPAVAGLLTAELAVVVGLLPMTPLFQSLFLALFFLFLVEAVSEKKLRRSWLLPRAVELLIAAAALLFFSQI
ncbi:hypothetical protein D6779_01570 [Candidatus Parcubacteria bacterium]|nr:MAG: hypothetical protein D6779_01570 [Candidatus Parcubacteria bacterium]